MAIGNEDRYVPFLFFFRPDRRIGQAAAGATAESRYPHRERNAWAVGRASAMVSDPGDLRSSRDVPASARCEERFVINEFIERPAPEIVAAFKELLRYDSVTCAISDCMGRFNAMTSDMRPLFEGIRLVGTAVTVKTIASDLAAAFKAIDVCQPGDIVVIDSHGSINTAFWGENMTMSALNRGVVAAVIDGACRDVEEIRRLRFPVICKGIVPNVGAVAGYGDVNVPIQCAGVAVSPGDVVVVDGNGVVVVPKVEAAAILDKAQRLLETEHVLQEKIKGGATIGELVDIDEVFKRTFSYQEKAVGETDSQADRGSAAS
jgi:4-hydroxy-4-methyl-2-oxoglutarate aldolase